jgi:hypothetical protein
MGGREQRIWQMLGALAVVGLAVAGIWLLSRGEIVRISPGLFVPLQPAPPDVVGELAPGALPAITAALGPDGKSRVTHVVDSVASPHISEGTHRTSGWIDGRPYGCAFDIAADDDLESTLADVRSLRLHGIAAWYRGPDSPDGAAGSGPHIHCVWPGAVTGNLQNLEQIASFEDGYQGLAHRQDPRSDWIDTSITSAEKAAVRHSYNTVRGRKPIGLVRPYDALHAHYQ